MSHRPSGGFCTFMCARVSACALEKKMEGVLGLWLPTPHLPPPPQPPPQRHLSWRLHRLLFRISGRRDYSPHCTTALSGGGTRQIACCSPSGCAHSLIHNGCLLNPADSGEKDNISLSDHSSHLSSVPLCYFIFPERSQDLLSLLVSV